jgi:hypothetical protein
MNAPHSQGIAPENGLSDLQRRCLDKRFDECTCALAEAVCALREAQVRAPRDASLHALCGLLRAADSLTACAHAVIDRNETVATTVPWLNPVGVSGGNRTDGLSGIRAAHRLVERPMVRSRA